LTILSVFLDVPAMILGIWLIDEVHVA